MNDDNLIIGGGGPLNINITPDDISPVVCSRCGCPLFHSAYPIGKISGIKLGLPTDQMVVVAEPSHICVKCGYPAGQEFNHEEQLKKLEELKSKAEVKAEEPENVVVFPRE